MDKKKKERETTIKSNTSEYLIFAATTGEKDKMESEN